MDHPLEGIQAKLHRAKEHMQLVGSEAKAFVNEGDSYSFVGEFEPERHAWVHRIRVNREPPLRLGVLVGDWAHNLRSALDHLAYALTVLDGGRPNRRTQFPIVHNKDDFPVLAKRNIPGVSAAHRAGIAKAQPYQAGDAFDTHPLYCLAELSNADKHRVVQPTYTHLDPDQPRKPLRRLDDDGGPSPVKRIWVAPPGQRVEDGAPITIMEFWPSEDPPVNVDVSGNFLLDVAFGERAISWAALPSISEYVVRVIETFRPDFPYWEAPDSG